MSPQARLVVLVCTAQTLLQVGTFTWQALLPGFLDRWAIDNATAGIVTSMYYAAYLCAVPVLVSLTDHVDPRRIYLFGVASTIAGHALFAFAADGPVLAGVARMCAGMGFAGAYMPGLKLLADRVDDRLLSRATAGHAASLGVAGALSFMLADFAAGHVGWRGTFAIAAACAGVSLIIAIAAFPRAEPHTRAASRPHPRDFLPVFRNRSVMAYALAYLAHTWEMSALRGWVVVFLTAAAAGGAADAAGWPAPAAVATMLALVGTGASVAGNEVSIRLGRRRLIRWAMALSAVLALLTGWLGPTSYGLAAVLVVAYGLVIWLDSSSLTAGSAGNAEPGRRGVTLAVHSMLGFGGGFVGPFAMGLCLDLAGGVDAPNAWLIGFAHLAVLMLAARLVFTLLRPKGLAGDRA